MPPARPRGWESTFGSDRHAVGDGLAPSLGRTIRQVMPRPRQRPFPSGVALVGEDTVAEDEAQAVVELDIPAGVWVIVAYWQVLRVPADPPPDPYVWTFRSVIYTPDGGGFAPYFREEDVDSSGPNLVEDSHTAAYVSTGVTFRAESLAYALPDMPDPFTTTARITAVPILGIIPEAP